MENWRLFPIPIVLFMVSLLFVGRVHDKGRIYLFPFHLLHIRLVAMTISASILSAYDFKDGER